jgi:5,10-methylenetetrahydromethanopterin reductase
MNRAIKFGVGFESPSAREQIAYARMAEELGFGACWVPEDYFYRGAFTIASALACATNRIQIGLGVVNPFTRHPALIAMEFAALNELAPGRTMLGIGAGVSAWMDQMRVAHPVPGRAIREAVEIIRRIFRGERVSFGGKVFQTDKVALSFDAPEKEIAIHVGVVGPKNLAMAGGIADGVLLSAMTSPAYARFALEHVRKGMEAAGRTDEPEMGAFVLASVSENEREARDAIKPLLAALISLMSSQAELALFASAGMDPDEVRRFGEVYAGGELPVRLVSDRIIDTFAIAGGPDRCREGLRKIIDAGITHPVFFEVPGVPVDKTIRAIHKYLMPHFL